MKPEKGSKELRKGRFSMSGCFYFITTSTFGKRDIFKDKQCFSIILNSLKWLEENKRIELYFLIMMPSHLHIIIKLKESYILASIMRSFKGYTGREIKKHLGLSTAIYQNQYYDHLIRKNESLLEIIKYCWYNPVRRELVESPYDYQYYWSRYEL